MRTACVCEASEVTDESRHVCRHVSTHPLQVCRDMYAETCIDVWRYVYGHMLIQPYGRNVCRHVCAGMHRDMHRDMYTGMCRGMHICTDMS